MADIGQVDVGEGDGKGGGEGAGVGLLDEVLLGDGVDHRRVVGAGDGDEKVWAWCSRHGRDATV